MAIVFEGDTPLLTVDTIKRVTLDYILYQFRNHLNMKNINESHINNEEQMAQFMLDNSDHRLRMYGSASELAEQMKIYRNFPESHKYFETTAPSPYYTTPTVYQSLKNEKYICKLDLFVYLHNLTFHKIPDLEKGIFRTLLAIFLKTQEEKISKKFEFVRYDPKVFEEIENEVEKLKNSITASEGDNIILTGVQMSGFSIDKAYEKWKKLIPTEWKEEEYQCVRDFLVEAHNKVDLERQSDFFVCLFFIGDNLIKTFQNIIGKRPEMFLLHSEVKNNKMPITVRLFEDGSQKFVMKEELFEAINKTSPGSDQIKCKTEKLYFIAIEMDEVFSKYRNRIQNIEFIRSPILRVKHKAVPIKGPNSEEFCILAVDALFDLFKHAIFGVKFFQKAKTSPNQVLILLKQLGVVFDPNLEYRCFVKMDRYRIFNNLMNNEVKLCDDIPAKDVRNAKKDGFTVENLKNELKHLGLTETFPEITDYAEIVYAEVVKAKREEFLRTCDLFDAIEHCQLICIFNRAPNLRKFLHNQKACGRVLTHKCDSCIGTSSNKSSSESLDSQNVPTISKPTEATTESEKNETKETATKVTSETIESRVCEKCLQTGVLLKEMEKKVIVLEKETSDTKEISEEIKRKLTEKLKEIRELEEKVSDHAELVSVNQILKKKISQLENSENRLKSKNSKLEMKVTEAEKQMIEEKRNNKKMVEDQKKELKNLKENHTRISKENDGLKLKISKLEDVQAQLKEENSKKESIFAESQRNLLEKVSHLEEDLKRKDQTFHKTQTDLQKRISYLESTLASEKQRSENLNKEIIESKKKSARDKANEEQKWMDERRRFEEDVIEKAKQINEFHTSNMQKIAEYETNGKMIQQILDSLTNSSMSVPIKRSNMFNTISRSYIPPHQRSFETFPTSENMLGNSALSTSSVNIKIAMHDQQNVRHHTSGYIPPHLRQKRVSNDSMQTSDASTSDNKLNSCEPSTSSSVNINSSFMNEQTITDLTDLSIYRSSPSDSNIGNLAQSVPMNECPTSLVKIPEKQRDEKDEKPINPQTTKSTKHTNSLQSVGAPEAHNLVDNNPISSSAVMNSLTPSKNLDKQKWSDQKPKTNSELEDSECLICFIDMKSIDKTIKCNQCRRRFHSNCASQWLKVKCECPACRGRLLDPHEFPSLS